MADARAGIGAWLRFYNDVRLHQAQGYQTPRKIFEADPTRGYVDNASALPTYPPAPQQQKEDSIDHGKVLGSATLSERLGELITDGALS